MPRGTTNDQEAEASFTEALEIAAEDQTLTVLMKVLVNGQRSTVNAAGLFAGQGHTDQAAALLEAVRRRPACERADREKAERLLAEMGGGARSEGTPP